VFRRAVAADKREARSCRTLPESPPEKHRPTAEKKSDKEDKHSHSRASHQEEVTTTSRQHRKQSSSSESESDVADAATGKSSSSSHRHRRASRLAGEKADIPAQHRQVNSTTRTDKSEDSEDEEKDLKKASSRRKDGQAKSKRVDTPWDTKRTESRRSGSSQGSNKSTVSFADSTLDEFSAGSDEEFYLPATQNRHFLKPPTFNGTGNFETFHARFLNCARYNKWNREEHLAHLRNALSDEAGQVLWDSGPEVTRSLTRLTKLLKERFGGAAQSDRYRMELRSRIRQPQETLTTLYRDIKKLITLGYPELDPKAREIIAVDRFIDSLGDANLALKIRERMPANLDEALKAGLQQEVWNRDASRIHTADATPKAIRAINEDLLKSVHQKIEQLQKQVDQVSRRQTKPIVLTTVAQTPATGQTPVADIKMPTTPTSSTASSPITPEVQAIPRRTNTAPTGPRPSRWPRNRPVGTCWTCGATDHQQASCPNKTPETEDRTPRTMPIRTCEATPPRTAKVYISGHIKTRPVTALLDTGSDVSLAPYDLVEKTKCRLRKAAIASLKAANGSEVILAGECILPLRVAGKLRPTTVLVSKDVSEVILGSGWLLQHDCEWEFAKERVRFGVAGEWIPLVGRFSAACRRIYVNEDIIVEPNSIRLIPARATINSLRYTPSPATVEPRQLQTGVYIGRTLIPPKHDAARVCVMNTTPEPITVHAGTRLGYLQPVDVLADSNSPLPETTAMPANSTNASPANTPAKSTDDSVIPKLMDGLPDELNADQRRAARQLFERYEDVFSKNEFDIGRTPLVECHIDTGNSRPIRQPLRRQPHKHMEAIDERVNEMLRHGVIEPAASPWASNVVLVSKKDGSLRFCVDYRAVNAVTYKDAYPLPLIDNCVNAMSRSSWFSTLDLRAGYHNIPVAEADRDKTAFVTRRGCWRYTVMPFGLTCSPSVFQRLMDMVLHGLSYDICLVYLDDIIIMAATFEEQLCRLEAVLQRLRWAKLKLKPSKCKLLQRKVEFLGHVISAEGVEMQTSKIEAVTEWPRPRSTHDVRSYMGLCGYYRRFIAGFADIAAPLHALTGKGVRFHWGPEQELAFNTLKEKLTTAPVLGMPDNEGQYILDTDASDVGLGAILSQVQNNEERVIAYASRTLQRPERNYETTKKELLAVVYGLKQFRQHLLGRPIIIRVDHAALTWLRRTAEPLPQLARWLTFIECFDYQVVHRSGKKHSNADTLSRRPEPEAENEVASTPATRAVHPDTTSPSADITPLPDTSSGHVTSDAVGISTTPLPESAAPLPESTVVTPDAMPANGATASPASPPDQTHPTSTDSTVSPRRRLRRRSNKPAPAPPPRWDDLAQVQQDDEDLRTIYNCKKNDQTQPAIEVMLTESETAKRLWSQWHRLELQNDVLCRKFEDQWSNTTVYQAIIPFVLRDKAIHECHAGMTGGHLGVKKTLNQVQRRFYWTTWRSDAMRYCRRCPECNAYHRGQLPRSAPLQPIIAGAPFERLSIDLTGPHTRSRRGNIYILTCIDPFTKWVEAFPIRNKEAETVARVLVEQVFCRYGVPIALLSDQGKEVDGKIMHEVCKLLEVDKLRTTPYKPSTNSVLERWHRSLNSMLGKVIQEQQTDWDEHLPYVLAAYRASKHDSTGYTPNALTLGRETRAPIDAVLDLPSPEGTSVTYDDFVEQIQSKLRKAYQTVRKELGRAAERNKHYYDLRVRPKRYDVGDWVYYYNPRRYRGRQEKWSRKFQGPYLITATPSAVNVTIQKHKRAKPFTVHLDKIKPYLAEPPPSWISTTTPGSGDQDSAQLEPAAPPHDTSSSLPDPTVPLPESAESNLSSVLAE